MKNNSFPLKIQLIGVALVAIITLTTAANTKNSDTLKVASYNLRINTISDTGDKSWIQRKKFIGQLINFYQFDVFGVQEISNEAQQSDLIAYLPNYTCLTKGRGNTSGTSGERIGIVFRSDRFEMGKNGFFFISEKPDSASKGWDAALNRIAVWAEFRDKFTNKHFYFFNVHLDHKGVVSRAEGAKLVVSKMKEIAKDSPVFCTGDFNATSKDTAMYNNMTRYYKDSRVASQTVPIGFVGTFNSFNVNATDFDENVRIDFIFTNNKVYSYSSINDKFVAGSFPSDHFPIMIKTKLK